MIATQALGIAGVAFRYQNVYGPGQSLSNPYTGILSIFSTRIKGGKDINIFEDGIESRDFVYIDDVVAATVLGIESDAANNQSFNVGTGVATSVLEVAETLMKHYGLEVPITVTGQFRLGDIRHNVADIHKAEKILGFKATVSFDEGIRNFSNWVNGQTIMSDKYEASLQEMKEKGLLK
jgi:dTDP-L-rhamnose 4-epimerase